MDEDKEGGKRRPGRSPNSSNFHSAESKTSETTGNVRTEKKEKRIYKNVAFVSIFFAKRVVVQVSKCFVTVVSSLLWEGSKKIKWVVAQVIKWVASACLHSSLLFPSSPWKKCLQSGKRRKFQVRPREGGISFSFQGCFSRFCEIPPPWRCWENSGYFRLLFLQGRTCTLGFPKQRRETKLAEY